MSDYRVQPIPVKGEADADGVWTNWRGEWLGDVERWTAADAIPVDQRGIRVTPRVDDNGNWIPAPKGWRDRIVEQLR